MFALSLSKYLVDKTEGTETGPNFDPEILCSERASGFHSLSEIFLRELSNITKQGYYSTRIMFYHVSVFTGLQFLGGKKPRFEVAGVCYTVTLLNFFS